MNKYIISFALLSAIASAHPACAMGFFSRLIKPTFLTRACTSARVLAHEAGARFTSWFAGKPFARQANIWQTCGKMFQGGASRQVPLRFIKPQGFNMKTKSAMAALLAGAAIFGAQQVQAMEPDKAAQQQDSRKEYVKRRIEKFGVDDFPLLVKCMTERMVDNMLKCKNVGELAYTFANLPAAILLAVAFGDKDAAAVLAWYEDVYVVLHEAQRPCKVTLPELKCLDKILVVPAREVDLPAWEQ